MSTFVSHHQDQWFTLIHDLCNPVSNIQAIHGLLQKELVSDHGSRSQELLDMLQVCCAEAEQLLTGLMRRTVGEASDPLSLQKTSLCACLEDFIPRYEAMATQRGHTFQASLEEKQSCVLIDENSFPRILNNLFSNALKFTPAPGTIRLSTRQFGNTVQISLEDTGVGIPSSLITSLFTLGKSASRPGVRQEASYGMGLRIVCRLTHQHHGTVTVDSTVGQGSRFTIHLPLLDR
ncbi:sensor histidine kinase [Tunicatimonas pelagia]|uniref:sensor histidine kinase n=1 Tax=Tunicatimonas pelagia TaxID=931531 RepID=UPI0026659689|nr:HAMP domain-containing sensor histidine kinase [Tunicatimonas pelagia]WKN44855.1 HAMP domain-containing sensor histidine kinase [Tunicatimonas pelagia]